MNLVLRILSCLCTLGGSGVVFAIAVIFFLAGNMGQIPHEARFANGLLITTVLGIIAAFLTLWRPAMGAGLGLVAAVVLLGLAWWVDGAIKDYTRRRPVASYNQRENVAEGTAVCALPLLLGAGLAFWAAMTSPAGR